MAKLIDVKKQKQTQQQQQVLNQKKPRESHILTHILKIEEEEDRIGCLKGGERILQQVSAESRHLTHLPMRGTESDVSGIF